MQQLTRQLQIIFIKLYKYHLRNNACFCLIYNCDSPATRNRLLLIYCKIYMRTAHNKHNKYYMLAYLWQQFCIVDWIIVLPCYGQARRLPPTTASRHTHSYHTTIHLYIFHRRIRNSSLSHTDVLTFPYQFLPPLGSLSPPLSQTAKETFTASIHAFQFAPPMHSRQVSLASKFQSCKIYITLVS